jgi:hypothetical protein
MSGLVYVIEDGEDEETISIDTDRGAAIPPIGAAVVVMRTPGTGGEEFVVSAVSLDLRNFEPPSNPSQTTWVHLAKAPR